MGATQSLRRPGQRVGLALAAACSLFFLTAVFLAPAARADAPVGTFTALSASPVAVTSVAIDPTTNLIYAQADGNSTPGLNFYSYNPSTDAWTELAPSPLPSGNNGGAVYVNGKIYTVYTGNDTDMGVYDIASNTWTTIPNPLGLGTGNITQVNGVIYLADQSSFVSYNPATNTTTTLANVPDFTGDCSGEGFESWGGLQYYNGKIYGHQGNGCNGFAVYDIASNTWSLLPNLPDDAVLGSALDTVTGTYYAYGSYGGSSFYEYSIASNTWTTINFPFSDINDGGMAYVSTPGQQGIYATFGEDSTGFTRFVTPLPSANLTIAKTASVSKATVGDSFSYSIKVTNGGPNTAFATKVTDTLPTDVSFVSSSTTAGSCSGSTTVTCSLGDLANGASATITITVKAVTAGTASNTATVSTTSTDTNASTTSTASVTIATPPVKKAKKLKLSVSPGSVVAGTHKCFAFKATSSGKGVGGVTVKFAGKKAHTSSKGKAQVCVTLKHKGTDRASATKKGYTTAHVSVHVKPKPAKKPVHFTG
jgi:uncharacterized repeat protein (TIGR01451 family)